MGHTSGPEPGGPMEEACLGLPAWSQVKAPGMLVSKRSLHIRHWARCLHEHPPLSPHSTVPLVQTGHWAGLRGVK